MRRRGIFLPHCKAAPLKFVNTFGFADPRRYEGKRDGTSFQCRRCQLVGSAAGFG